MDIINGRGSHLNPTSSPSIPTPSSQLSSRHKPSPSPSSPSPIRKIPQNTKRKPQPTSWADLVDESRQHNNSNSNNKNKKQRLTQIMNWPTAPPKPALNPHQPLPNPSQTPRRPIPIPNATTNTKSYEHKDGDKLRRTMLVASGEKKEEKSGEGGMDAQHCDAHSCDTQSCDAQSCDSHSTLSSDAMSCDTLSSCDSNFGEHEGGDAEKKKKKKKKSKKNRKYSVAEEGKKLFVGGIKFELCDAILSNSNETLEMLRHQKFSQIFYLFGAVNRVQGHWSDGYCFVVFTTRKAAKLAMKCLAFAAVRRKVVQNLQDNIGPTGILPLPSFYVRWANNPNNINTPRLSSSLPSSSLLSSSPLPVSPLSSSLPSSLPSSSVAISPLSASPPSISPSPSSFSSSFQNLQNEEVEEMEWLNGIKEENMGEKEVERLMQELLKLRD